MTDAQDDLFPRVNYLTEPGDPRTGRWAELNGEPEEDTFDEGADLRHPRYRREIFLRFYEFHLAYRSHPGCVYLALPWLQKRFGLDREQVLWMAFINGNTQNVVTTARIFRQFPDFRRLTGAELKPWYEEHYSRLAFDTDRRYHKKDFLSSVACYMRLTGGDQVGYFNNLLGNETEGRAFQRVWAAVRKEFHTFGRLSAFSYLEYLRIVGLPLVCDTLFLRDMDGSRSHRNGLARVLGRDDLDWHASTGFSGKYWPDQIPWLESEAELLLSEARARCASVPDVDLRDVNYFTLESAFCTFKSWFRPNRRYPNVYADMMVDRIRRAERDWGAGALTTMFWTMRGDCLPPHLRSEDNPRDPGLVPRKQNYFRETGRPVMMSRRWPEFGCAFDREVWVE